MAHVYICLSTLRHNASVGSLRAHFAKKRASHVVLRWGGLTLTVNGDGILPSLNALRNLNLVVCTTGERHGEAILSSRSALVIAPWSRGGRARRNSRSESACRETTGKMADLEAVLADVSYLMAMEKSKSTPAARASKKIVLPDPRLVR